MTFCRWFAGILACVLLLPPTLSQNIPPGTIDLDFANKVKQWLNHQERLLHWAKATPAGSLLVIDDPPNEMHLIDEAGNPDLNFSKSRIFLPILELDREGRILEIGSRGTIFGPPLLATRRFLTNGSIDRSFISVNHLGFIDHAAFPADGKIVAGGADIRFMGDEFTPFGLARLNENGSLDASYAPQLFSTTTNAEPDASITGLALLAEERLLVFGNIIRAGQSPSEGMAALKPDGSLDEAFQPGINGPANALSLRNGKLLVFGAFTSYRGQAVSPPIRLNSDLTLDATFRSELQNLSGPKFLEQPDGKLLVSNTEDNSLRAAIYRLHLDGSQDPAFPPVSMTKFSDFQQQNVPLGSPVLTLSAGGKLIAAGGFTSCNGFAVPGIAALYLGDISTPVPAPPRFTAEPQDAAPPAGRAFTLLAEVSSPEMPVWQWTLNGENIPGATNQALHLPDLQIWNSGAYQVTAQNSYGVSTSRVAVVKVAAVPPGSLLPDLASALVLNGSVSIIKAQQDGKLLIAGSFSQVSGAPRQNLARLQSDGRLDLSFAPPADLVDAANPTNFHLISDLALTADGRLLVGGHSPSIILQNASGATNGVGVKRLLADGSIDPSFNYSAASNRIVNALGIRPDGHIVVGDSNRFPILPSNFSERPLLSLLDPDGRPAFGELPGLSRMRVQSFYYPFIIETITFDSDNSWLLGGMFYSSTANSSALIRVGTNGAASASFSPAIEALEFGGTSPPQIGALALQSDRKILIGGAFNRVGGQVRPRIARLHPDGSLDESFNPGRGIGREGRYSPYAVNDIQIYAIALQADGKILIGGKFWNYDTNAAPNLVRVNADGSIDSMFEIGSGPNGPVRAIQPLPDGSILVGGDFTEFNGVPQNGIALLRGTADARLRLWAQPGPGGLARLYFKSEEGKTYTLQFRNALSEAEWQTGPSVSGSGAVLSFASPAGQNAQAYFRLLEQ